MSGLLDCWTRMRALCGYDSEIASGNLPWVGSGVKSSGEIRRAADAQAALGDGARLLFRNVVGVDLDIFEARQMGAENAADGSTTHDANPDRHAVFNSSNPE
jgi:hypothetical protein